jgi:RNA polymerase sigma-70 factor (ECF subfamily)
MENRVGQSSGRARTEPVDDAACWLDQHGDALYRHARSRVARRELAEDLVQETLLAGLAARPKFRGESDVRTWLLAILRRKVADHYRKNRLTSDAEREWEAISEPRTAIEEHVFDHRGLFRRAPLRWKPAPDRLESEELRKVLDACLAHLPSRFAVAFTLREIDDLPPEEIRGRHKLSAGNLRVRLYRARLLLRECLEKNWFAPDPPNSASRA